MTEAEYEAMCAAEDAEYQATIDAADAAEYRAREDRWFESQRLNCNDSYDWDDSDDTSSDDCDDCGYDAMTSTQVNYAEDRMWNEYFADQARLRRTRGRNARRARARRAFREALTGR